MERKVKEVVLKLKSHRLWIETLGEQGEKLAIDEVDLRSVDLSHYPLDQAYMTACIFNEMNLKFFDFSSSLLSSSTFISANLTGVDFCKANLSYADFTNSNIKAARFADSECIETVFVGAELSGANLVAGHFQETDFRDATLFNADISLAVFENVLLKGSILKSVRGLETAFIKSINIGTPKEPAILVDTQARQWLKENSE